MHLIHGVPDARPPYCSFTKRDHERDIPESTCPMGSSFPEPIMDRKSPTVPSREHLSGSASGGDVSNNTFHETVSATTTYKPFSCVVVTHWVVHEQPSTPCEILEFSWVIYHIPSASILENARVLVQPTETSLETISETTLSSVKLLSSSPVARTKTLEQVLTQFNTSSSLMNPPCVCVISDAVSLRDQLLAETFRKGIPVPQCLRSVLDLSTLAPHFYAQQFFDMSKQQTFSPREIAKHLSIQVSCQGDEFRSMQECLIMCQIVHKFFLDQIHFQNEHLSTVITIPVAGSSCSGTPTTFTKNDTVHETSCGPTSDKEQDYVIRLRGVPWGVTKDDVTQFLKPVCWVMPSDIFIGMTYDGKASGEVYVRLSSSQIRDQCIQELHGRYMGSRWIEVFKGCLNDIQHMSSLPISAMQERIGAVWLRGLPWSTKPVDLVQFFLDAGFTITPNAIVWGRGVDGRFNGDAWVLLSNAKEAENVQRVLHKRVLKKRYVEVFPATMHEVEVASRGASLLVPTNQVRGIPPRATPYSLVNQALPAHLNKLYNVGNSSYSADRRVSNPHSNLPQRHSAARGTSGSHETFLSSTEPVDSDTMPSWITCVLRMRGLPYHATEDHIATFFSGYGIKSIVTAGTNAMSRPSGEGYVEFTSRQEAWRALRSKNGETMEHRYIELFPVN